jgi:hypothetical protein
MDPVDALVAAVVSGAAAGATSVASATVADSYRSVRQYLRQRLGAHRSILDALERDPQNAQLRGELRKRLDALGWDADGMTTALENANVVFENCKGIQYGGTGNVMIVE